MKATSTILLILLFIPVILTAGEPGFRARLQKPLESFITPYPDDWEDPVISIVLDEYNPAFNYRLTYTRPPVVDTSSFDDGTLTFSYTYYRLGRDRIYTYIPRTVDARGYSDYRIASNLKREMRNVRSEALAKAQRDKRGGAIGFNVPIGETFSSIVGEGGVGLTVSGYHRINLSGRSSWTDGGTETATFKQNKFPSLNMEQVSRFDINGTIGSKITVSVSQDSKTSIPLANRIRLRYKGDEDDILKSVEAGNTNLSLPNTKFVGYSQNIQGLFGLKAEAQIGGLSLTAIASQEKGNSERTSIDAGASASKNYIRDYSYASGRIFDLGRLDSRHFDESELDFHAGDSIISIQVYVASTSSNSINNDVNDPEARFWVDPTDTTVDTNEFAETNVKILDPAEYNIGPSEFWIEFERAGGGTNNEIGVYMIVQRNSGAIDTIGSVTEEPYSLKLIRNRTKSNSYATYYYEWRNVYSLNSQNIDVNGLEINVYKGLVNTEDDGTNYDHQDGENYIKILGLDRYNQSGELVADGLVDVNSYIIDRVRGLLIFPDRRPFDPSQTFGNVDLVETVPEIYEANAQQDMVKASKYYIEVSNRSRNTQISLGKPNIIENSEKITLGGRELKKGVDYNINYDFGQVTFLTDEALDPNADISIDFEYSPFITAQKKTLFGMRGEYEFSDNLKLGSTFLYKSDKATDRKPKVGEETAKAMVVDADMSMKFQPNILSDIVDLLPLYSTEAQSNIQFSAEVAQSYPNPNVDGIAYIDDFEGSRDSYSLGIFKDNWTMSSKPVQLDSTNARGNLIWYNPYIQIATDDIWNRDLAANESGTHTLWLEYTPPDSVLVPDTTDEIITYNYEQVDPLKGWAGIIRSFTAGAVNQDQAQLLELRIQGDSGILHFDFGEISEDVDGDGFDDDEDVKITGVRDQNNILDNGEDIGLDGLPDEEEPGYDAVLNPDPNGDNWYYNGAGDGCNGCDENDYSHINGTEGNGKDPGRLGRPDSEDISGDGSVQKLNNYFSFEIDLADTLFLVDSSEYNGWRTFRIPIRDEAFIDTIIGDPDWSRTNFVRLWCESSDGTPFMAKIAAADLIQSNWEDTLIVLDTLGDENDQSVFNVAVINNQENSNYVSPPGVEGYYDKTNEYREPEQSLLLSYENLKPGDSCLASMVLFNASSYVGYRTLKMWVHGDDFVDLDSALFFYRVGNDNVNYYEFRTYLRPGWDSANQVDIEFENITLLKETLLQAKVDNPDTNQIYSSDSTYRVYGNPTFTKVKYMAAGIINNSRDTLYNRINGEVWINELRVTDVRRNSGTAARATVSGNVADLFTYNASYEYMDSYFRSISSSTRGGSGNNLGSGETRKTYNYGLNFKLDRLLPKSFGANIPINYRYAKTEEVPRLRFGTDIELPPALQEEEKTISESKSLTVNESFNKNTRNPLFTVLLNKLKTSFSYSRNDGTSPKTPMSMSENYRVGANYALNFTQNKIPNITPFFWTKPIPYLNKLEGNKFYFIPNSFSMSGSFDRNLSISRNSSDIITKQYRRTFGGNMKVGYRISEPLAVNFSMNTNRDLNDPDLINIVLDPKKFKLGRETGYGQSFGATYGPNIFSFLTHSLNYSVGYRESYNVTDSTRRADETKSYGVSGVFDHKKLFGLDKAKRSGRRNRGRRGEGDDEKKGVIVVGNDESIFTKMLKPFTAMMGFLTGWINPFNYDYNEKYAYSFSGLKDRATWKFRMGVTDDIGVARKDVTNTTTSGAAKAITRTTGYSLRSGTKLFGGIKTDVTYSKKIAQDVYKATNAQKTESTTFPDIKFTIQPLTTFKFLNPFIRRFSPRTSYSRSTGQTYDIQQGSKKSDTKTITMKPLLSLNVNVLHGVNINFSTDRIETEDKTFNQSTSDLINIRRNIQTSTTVSAKYSFASPKGIKIPIFGRLKFKSTLTLQCDFSIRNQKGEVSEADSPNLYTPTAERSDLVISPIISYSFSQQIKGGITAKWQTSNDKYRDRTTQTRELRIWVDIRF